ncbi:low-specificity L-threonine aldolase [Candidatus Bipolaricaulota sp. J31]
MRIVDLRSDTVTLPPPAMREAILRAPLGDDVYGEDPTVRALEERAAELTGKEAALLVASGTMGNLVSILAHCGRGDEVILGDRCHTFLYEAGGIAALGGIHPHPVPNEPDGTIPLERIEAAIRPENIHFPRTRLICLENTHNRCWGSPLTPEYTAEVVALARRYGLSVHVDGARIFNAAVALGVEVRELVREVGSVTFCLSKGLAAPVGSVICGERGFIEEARRVRKTVGGGMRQAGIIAACGLYALEHMVERLAEDHEHAQLLARGVANIDGLITEPDLVRTNIVYFELERGDPAEFHRRAQAKGVLFHRTGPRSFRLVTHYGVTRPDIDYALSVLADAARHSV